MLCCVDVELVINGLWPIPLNYKGGKPLLWKEIHSRAVFSNVRVPENPLDGV